MTMVLKKAEKEHSADRRDSKTITQVNSILNSFNILYFTTNVFSTNVENQILHFVLFEGKKFLGQKTSDKTLEGRFETSACILFIDNQNSKTKNACAWVFRLQFLAVQSLKIRYGNNLRKVFCENKV